VDEPTGREALPDIYSDFHSASRAVLEVLHQRLGFRLWMITRVDQDDCIVLAARDDYYGVTPGTVSRWQDLFSSRMVLGQGPRIAPRAREVPAYRDAPIGRHMPIEAYIGLPLCRPDGSLFGTLCAIDPAPQPVTVRGELPLLALLAGMLSTILAMELQRDAQRRQAETVANVAERDPLTGVYNRGGWDARLQQEEARCARYGSPAGVVLVDLDDLKLVNDTRGHAAGDELLRRAADAMMGCTRDADVLARLGGDEFAFLAVDCNAELLPVLARRLRDALEAHGVQASVGASARHPTRGLQVAVREADRAMYADKQARKRWRAGARSRVALTRA
jgi:diguanylate cyclase